MSRELKSDVGPIPLIMMGLMLLSVVWSVQAAAWTAGLHILQGVSLGSMVVGIALARWRRLPQGVAHFVGIVVGAAWTALLLTLIFNADIVPAAIAPPSHGVTTKLVTMARLAQQWIAVPSSREAAWLSNWMFVVLMAILCWLMSYVASWAIVRWQRVWVTVALPGAAALINTYYGPPNMMVYFVVFCFAALLLVVSMRVHALREVWKQEGVNHNLDVELTFLRDGAVVTVLAILLAWMLPAAAVSPRLSGAWSAFQQPWHEVQAQWNRIFTSLNYQGPSTLISFGPRMTLGGAVNLTSTPIFAAQSPEPHYWRAVSYDTYSGTGWLNTDPDTLAIRSSTRLNPQPYAMQQELTITITTVEPGQSILFLAGQPVRSSAPARARLRYLPVSGAAPATEVSILESPRALGRNVAYTVVCRTSAAGEPQLRAAGSAYPAWILELYLTLPATLPPRVHTLARDLARGQNAPYNQALAVQQYLRTIPYDRSIPPPPVGRDVVDWFLFDIRRGYCDYYATAMAVLCRSLGVPARVSQGYSPGDYDSGTGTYRVLQHHAHAWPEVYIPEYGWIPFEPTSSEPLLVRSDGSGLAAVIGGVQVGPAPPIDDEGSSLGPKEKDIEDADFEEPVGDGAPVRRNWRLVLMGLTGAVGVLAVTAGAWWILSLRGLSTAARTFEQMRRLGVMLRCNPLSHHTPAEYGQELARVLPRASADIHFVVDTYVLQRFGAKRLDEAREQELERTWKRLGLRMLGQALLLRGRSVRPAASEWVPSSALRPPSSLQ